MSSPHTILLVDDEPLVIATLGRALRRAGHRALTVTTPQEAMAILDEGGVDLIVSDVDMPGMSGLDLVARVRERHPHIVRFLLTGHQSFDAAIDAINHGEVHRYFTKPWSTQEILAAIDEMLARLDEVRRSAAADALVHSRKRLLDELEREHPGISVVRLDDGAHVLDVPRIENVASGITHSALRALFSGAPTVAPAAATLPRPSPRSPAAVAFPVELGAGTSASGTVLGALDGNQRLDAVVAEEARDALAVLPGR